MPDFCHLHNHTQYSLLDGASDIKTLIKKAVQDEMKAQVLSQLPSQVFSESCPILHPVVATINAARIESRDSNGMMV